MSNAAPRGKLSFSSPDPPRVSVVVVAWRTAPHLLECLEHLRESSGVTFELLLALNEPSRELSAQVRGRISGATVCRSAANLGYAAACNRAAAKAVGEFVMLLNDDALLRPDSLPALVGTLDEVPEAYAAGSRFLYPDGSLQEAGAVVWGDGSVFQVSRLVRPGDDVVGQRRRVDYCSGAALLVRRAAWEAVGGMDEGYFPAYYEDVDLCMKLAVLGGQVLYGPRSVVTHVMGASASLRYREYLVERNRKRFVERWGEALASFPPRPELVEATGVMAAVEQARSPANRVFPSSLPAAVSYKRRSGAACVAEELAVTRDLARHLEADLDRLVERAAEQDEELAQLRSELLALRSEVEQQRQSVAELSEAVDLRDRFLAQDQLQLEELARERAAAVGQLEALLERRSHQLVERLAEEVRAVPGAQAVVRRLLGTASH